MKKIKAIFRGTNGSCGYESNKEYTLYIESNTSGIIIRRNRKGWGICQYSNIEKFLDNWDNIRVL